MRLVVEAAIVDAVGNLGLAYPNGRVNRSRARDSAFEGLRSRRCYHALLYVNRVIVTRVAISALRDKGVVIAVNFVLPAPPFHSRISYNVYWLRSASAFDLPQPLLTQSFRMLIAINSGQYRGMLVTPP